MLPSPMIPRRTMDRDEAVAAACFCLAGFLRGWEESEEEDVFL